jgi:hypothetical protein
LKHDYHDASGHAVEVRFMSLTADATGRSEFREVGRATFPTSMAATAAVKLHAELAGFTNVKLVDDDDESLRWTATTPGGRAGRNVAFGDWDVPGV